MCLPSVQSGSGLYIRYGTATLVGSAIYQNGGRGLDIGGSGAANLDGCRVYENAAGGLTISGTATLVGSAIYQNEASVGAWLLNLLVLCPDLSCTFLQRPA